MLSILFLGDIFLNKSRRKQIELSDPVNEIIGKCDWVCYNLEGPIVAMEEKPISKKGPAICQDAAKIQSLFKDKKILYDLANNHIMDYGVGGLKNTLNTVGSQRVGADEIGDPYVPYIIREQECSVGIIAVAEGGFGVSKDKGEIGYAWFRHRKIEDIIATLKKNCQYVIVLSHAGLEGVIMPLPEIREIYRSFIDMGADMVIAHHPHVIQGREFYKKRQIFYSLGNCMFDTLDGKGESNENSIGVLISIDDTCTGAEVIPLQYKNGILDLSEKSKMLFEQATNILEDEKRYLEEINAICYERYLHEYQGFYKAVLGSMSRIKRFYLAGLELFGKQVFDEDMLYHNLAIESHYWTTVRGIEYAKTMEKI